MIPISLAEMRYLVCIAGLGEFGTQIALMCDHKPVSSWRMVPGLLPAMLTLIWSCASGSQVCTLTTPIWFPMAHPGRSASRCTHVPAHTDSKGICTRAWRPWTGLVAIPPSTDWGAGPQKRRSIVVLNQHHVSHGGSIILIIGRHVATTNHGSFVKQEAISQN